MKTRLANYFRASFPCVAIRTSEEQRATADVIGAAKSITGKSIATWSATEGLIQIFPTVKEYPDTADPLAAFRVKIEDCIYILRDVQGCPFDRDFTLVRAFRDLLSWGPSAGSCVVAIGPFFTPHQTIEKMCVVLDYTLPGPEDLNSICIGIAESATPKITFPTPEGHLVIRALSGMSTTEAENALSLSLIETGVFDPAVLYREKTLNVKRSGLLEIVEPDPAGINGIGGNDVVKEYMRMRTRAFSPEAEKYRLDPPKGVLVVGVPGTGKSLLAKIAGTVLGLPTLRLDIGALFNSLVGESESRTRDALALAEAVSPCVLWVDEIDKGLAGASGSGSNDSGVTKRVFGTIISWMQERRRPVFLIATANDVTSLPPEFLRKGRFDEIFAVDLPSKEERAQIFNIHLQKRGRNDVADLMTLAAKSDGFTGSEIEAVIVDAMFRAFDQNREVAEADILAAISDTTPLSVMAKEKVDAIREWARGRARLASSQSMGKGAELTVRKINLKGGK